MANVLFKKGLLKNLPAEKVAGTIYVTTDERAMYLDVDASTRIRLGDFNEIPNLNALPDVSHTGGAPNPTGLYYSVAENVLARYDSANKKWAQINPDNWYELKSFTQKLTSNTANGTTTVQVVSKIEQVNENNQSGGRHGSQYNSILKFKDGGSVTISTEGTAGPDGVTTLDTIKISATDQSVSDVAHHYTPSGDGTLVGSETDTDTGNTFITGVKTDAAGHVVKVTKKDAVIDKVSNARLTSSDETAGSGEKSAVNLNFAIDHGTRDAATAKIRISGAGATTVTHSSDSKTIQISSTDQSVSDAAHHYPPTAVPGSKIEVASGTIISEIQRDDKGHITGVDTRDENKVSTVSMKSGSTTGGVSIATKVANARGGSPEGSITLKGSGDTTITSTDSGTSVTIETHDTKVTSAANHYKAKQAKDSTQDIVAGTYEAVDSVSSKEDEDVTAGKAKTPVVTGVTIDAAGHVTGITATKIADTHAELKTAALSAQASGWQLSVTNSDNSAATGTFDPTIKYGKNSEGATTKEVHGQQGSFILDTYTTEEVDAKITTAIQATGAMVLKDELTSTKSLPTTKVSAGDTYIVTADGITVAGYKCEVGDLFVAKADMATGSDDNNWYYVPSGNDKHIIIGKTNNAKDRESVGAVLIDGNETAGAQYGSINFNSTAAQSPSGIKATMSEGPSNLGSKDVSFTFSMEWGSF